MPDQGLTIGLLMFASLAACICVSLLIWRTGEWKRDFAELERYDVQTIQVIGPHGKPVRRVINEQTN